VTAKRLKSFHGAIDDSSDFRCDHEPHITGVGDSFPSDTVVKREMLAGMDKSRIIFVVEDRSRVVEMWRSEGLVCLQCAPGEF